MAEVVTEAGGRWIGIVADARGSVSDAHSDVYSTPSAGTVCVVPRGDAYSVETTVRDKWPVLKDSPMVAVRQGRRE